MRKRNNKKTDQEETEKAYRLLVRLVKNHPEIETSLWGGALISAFVNMHVRTGFSYKDFCGVLDNVKDNYKAWWEQEKD